MKRQCYACDREQALRKKQKETPAQRERRLRYLSEYNSKRREYVREFSKTRYKARREEILQGKKQYGRNNRKAISAKSRARYIKNRAVELAKKKLYRENNRGAIAALNALRRARVRQRTPKWIGPEERWLMREAYILMALRSDMTGFAWHVDHEVPLQGEFVSGLHVPINLRVIPGADNLSKHNKFDPEAHRA